MNENVKSFNVKKHKIIAISAICVLLIGSGVLGYLYYKSNKNFVAANVKIDDLGKGALLTSSGTTVKMQELITQNDKLTKENGQLQKDNTTLTSDKTAATATAVKVAKAKTYNDTLTYIAQLMSLHNGFDGWTDAEYAEGRRIAGTTEDQSFLELIDWAWAHAEINSIERLTAVLKTIASNINNNIK